MPGAKRTRSLVCAWELSMHTSIHSEFAEIIRHPHAMVYGLFRALPGDRAVLPPSPAEVAFRQLDASVEASGPHVFAVRLKRIRQSAISVHRIPSRVRDDREPPLWRNRTAAISEVIWVGREAEIFLQTGLDRGIKNRGGALCGRYSHGRRPPRKRGDPVRCGFSIQSQPPLEYRITRFR
jgi:hypothetical protein